MKCIKAFLLLIFCISLILPGFIYGASVNNQFLDAMMKQDIKKVKKCLEKKADVNIKNEYGVPMLVFAVGLENYGLVELLIQYRADVNIQDTKGNTSLMLATQTGNEKITKFLIKKGASLSTTNVNLYTPLLLAAYYGHLDTVKLLIESGADIEQSRIRGGTALSIASAQQGFLKILKYLVKKNAKINSSDTEGITGLMQASYMGHNEIVSYLLKMGANPDMVDGSDRSAIDFAEMENNIKTIKILSRYSKKKRTKPEPKIKFSKADYEPELLTASTTENVLFYYKGIDVGFTAIKANTKPDLILKSKNNFDFKIIKFTSITLNEALDKDKKVTAYLINEFVVKESGLKKINAKIINGVVEMNEIMATLAAEDFINNISGSESPPDPKNFTQLRNAFVYNLIVEDSNKKQFPMQTFIETFRDSSELE